jgi:hypothetical protein
VIRGFTSLASALVFLCACAENTMSMGGGTGGMDPVDAGHDCPTGPVALLNLTIHAQSGPVPTDTSLAVSWSAGPEPTFLLDDPTTWGSLDNGANVVCDVDPSEPPPSDLMTLVCHLWTSGATAVTVSAKGFETWSSTLKPDVDPVCKAAVPTKVDVTLVPVGTPGT